MNWKGTSVESFSNCYSVSNSLKFQKYIPDRQLRVLDNSMAGSQSSSGKIFTL